MQSFKIILRGILSKEGHEFYEHAAIIFMVNLNKPINLTTMTEISSAYI